MRRSALWMVALACFLGGSVLAYPTQDAGRARNSSSDKVVCSASCNPVSDGQCREVSACPDGCPPCPECPLCPECP